MAKIVIFNIPAQGHTNPTLGIVKALIARGHEVVYYSYEPVRDKIEATGAAFVSCDRYDKQTSLSPEDSKRISKDLAFSINLIVDMTLALDDAVLVDMKEMKPDVIIADSMAFWGKLIAHKLGIPFISSTTTFAFNKYSARVIQQGGGGNLFTLLLSMPKINKSLNRLRNKGYQVKNLFSVISNENDTNTIVYTAPAFQPYVETFSNQYQFVGASIRPIQEPMAKADKPFIYISLGTVLNDNQSFYQSCIEAFQNQDYDVLMAVGEEVDRSELENIPSHIKIVTKADQMAALSIADVFITHCGMNSVNEALYFGVPMVLFPQTPEQSGVASHTSAMGAGLLLKGSSTESIQKSVEAVLHEAGFKEKAEELSKAFHACGGAKQAVAFIESIVADAECKEQYKIK